MKALSEHALAKAETVSNHDPDGWGITCDFYASVAVIGAALLALWSIWP